MLTKRQKQILNFITKYISKNDYAPTLEEIKGHFGLSSVSTIHEHLQKLKESGYLDRPENQPRAIEVYSQEKMIQIPLLGTIAAGKPIEAIEDMEKIKVPRGLVPQNTKKYFVLKVKGDSMIGDGIIDGDTVVVKKQSTIEDGESAVVYLPEKNEATLKKIYKEKNRVRLQPANPEMKPFYEKNVEIRGKVVGVLRKYGQPTK